MKILITGGAGYIGSHVSHLLVDRGYDVTIIDSLLTGNKKLIPKKAKFINSDISNVKKINKILQKYKFDLVIHFAGLIRVDESVKFPKKYIYNNYEKTKIFLNICLKNGLKKIKEEGTNKFGYEGIMIKSKKSFSYFPFCKCK